jgi:hypothetical protein
MNILLFSFSLAFVACVAITLYHGDGVIPNQMNIVLDEQSSVQARINSVVKKAGKKLIIYVTFSGATNYLSGRGQVQLPRSMSGRK